MNEVIDLVLPTDLICNECKCFKPLIPYKGNEVNTSEPDRLVCSECGKEFAISMNNDKRQIRRLTDKDNFKDFWDSFIKTN